MTGFVPALRLARRGLVSRSISVREWGGVALAAAHAISELGIDDEAIRSAAANVRVVSPDGITDSPLAAGGVKWSV